MRDKASIRRKITSTVFIVSIVALLALGCATVVNISIMRNQIVETDKDLGAAASADSAAALEQETRAKMQTVSMYLGQLADEKLGRIRNSAVILANTATAIFSNPENYAPREIGPASDQNAGKVTLYFTKPLAVPLDSVSDEARLAANAGDYMRQILAVDSSALTCYVSFNDGLHVICDADSGLRTAADYDYDPTTRGWFKLARERGEVGFTDITVDAQGRGLGVVCSAPFHDADGRMLGAVGIGVLIDEVDQLILSADMGSTGDAFVLNDAGEMIIGKEVGLSEDGKGFVRPSVTGSSEAVAALGLTDGGSGVRRIAYGGREVYMAWYPIQSAGWTLVTTMDVEEALTLAQATSEKISAMSENSVASVDRSIVVSIVIIVAVLIVTAACVAMAGLRRSRAITEPLKRLTESVGMINGGDLTRRIDIRTGDEIEELASSFNHMTGQLNEYIRNLTAVTAEKERIGAELDVATRIQASMLPCIFPAFPARQEFDIFATMTPAKEVGGDFYDFFLVDEDHLAVVIADVSGKGVPAALFMVIAKTLIKNHAQSGRTPDQVFTAVNAQLCENNDAGMFVTGWLGLYTISTGKLTFANAGHNPPLVKREDGRYEFLRARAGFVLAGMEDVRYKANETTLQQGDALFLYTDGVTEATSADTELYGEDRLTAVLNAHPDATPTRLLPLVKADIDRFVGNAPQFDDITMVCLRVRERAETELTVPASDAQLPDVLAFVDAEMGARGFGKKNRGRVAVAVEELFVNIAHYAYPDGGGEARIVCAWYEATNTLEIAFYDRGVAYNPLAKPDPDLTLSAQERDIGGLGVFIAKKTMDAVRYEYLDGQNVMVIAKKRTEDAE